MDMSMIQQLIPDVAGWLNVDPATLLLYLGITCSACNLIGRMIPDDKTGPLGVVRNICKVVGLYAPNKITTGITTSDVVKGIVTQNTTPEVKEAAQMADALIPSVVEDIAPEPVKDVFTKYRNTLDLDPDESK